MSQRIVKKGAILGLLLLGVVVLSACGAAPVAENWPGLTLADGTIYVVSGSPQRIYILDAETGVQKATFVPQGEHSGVVYWSPVAVGGGVAFVGFAESQKRISGLYAFDPETGQELWQVPAQSLIIPAPVYSDGAVYFGSSDGYLYAVDVETHTIKPGWPYQAEEAIWASPIVKDGSVYLAAKDHYLTCLDAETGELKWKYDVGAAMAAQPTLDSANGVIYVGAFDGRVHAVKVDSGESVEGFDFQSENWIWSEILLEDGVLYVTSLDGNLYALNPATGAVLPPYPYNSGEIDDQDEVLRAAPVQAGDSIIVATESGKVIAVKDAARQWYWPSGVPQSGILTTPLVADDTIYVVLLDGQVNSLSADSGGQGWSFVPPQEK